MYILRCAIQSLSQQFDRLGESPGKRRLSDRWFRRLLASFGIVVLSLFTMVPITQPVFAAGGAYMLDYSAADPGLYIPPIPFPNALTAPTGSGNGNPLIPLAQFHDGATQVNVESLAPEDMALGQIVPFETQIAVSGDTTPENGVITIVFGWNTLTTNGNDFGYDARVDDIGYGVIGAFIDTGDGDSTDTGTPATVDSFQWSLINDEIVGIFTVSGLDDGDTVILEMWLVLDDTIPAGVGGNVQSRLIDAATGSDQSITVANSGSISLDNGDAISTGNQTVPLLRPSDFFSADVDLSVTKTDDVDPIVQGETLTYTITASNAGPSVANSVVVYDELDPNVTFVSASDGGFINTDSGDAVPDGAVQWNVGSLAPGDSVQYTVTVTVNADAPTDSPTGEDLLNTVTVTTISDDVDPTNDVDTEPTDVESSFVPAPGITLLKTGTLNDDDGTAGVSAGDTISYTFTVTNTGNVTLTNVTLADTVGGVTISGGPIASLAPGVSDNTTFTGSYTITQADIDAGTFTNTATATGQCTAAACPVSDPDDDTQTLAQTPAIELLKTGTLNDDDGTAGVSAGDTISYAFTVTNTGNVTLTNVTLVDTVGGVSVNGGPDRLTGRRSLR